MSTIPAPDIFRDTLDEYTRSTQLNQAAQQLRQQKLAQAQNNEIDQGQLANQTDAQQNANQLAPVTLQQQKNIEQQQEFQRKQQDAILGATQAAIKRGPNGEPQGIDYGKLENEATARGALPGSTNELQKQRLALQEQTQKLTDEQATAHLAENKRMYETAESLRGVTDPAERAQAYQQVLMKEHSAGRDIGGWPPQTPTDADLDKFEGTLGMHQQALADAKDVSETNKNNRAASASQLEAQYLTLHTQKLLSKQKGPDGQPLAAPLDPVQSAAHDSYEHNKLLTPTANFNFQNGGAVNPEDVAWVASGQGKISDVIPPRAAASARQAFVSAVLKVNPNFKSYDNEVDKKIIEDLTSGGKSNTLLAYNTALRHADVFSKVADALDNGDVRALNSLGNTLGTQFGSDKATNFGIAKTLFADEFAKAATGANVGVTDREKTQELLSSASSPAQFKGAVATAKALLAGKRDAMMEQAKQGLQGKADFGQGAAGTGTTRIKASDGSLHDIPTANLDKAKQIDPKLQVIQ